MAVRVIAVPSSMLSLQSEPQLIPEPVMVPRYGAVATVKVMGAAEAMVDVRRLTVSAKIRIREGVVFFIFV